MLAGHRLVMLTHPTHTSWTWLLAGSSQKEQKWLLGRVVAVSCEDHHGLGGILRQNISYSPVVWSAYGRPHSDTLAVFRSLSKSIARKRNIASAEVVFHRLHSSITLEIWRRSARQVRACWPVTALPADLVLDTQPLMGLVFLPGSPPRFFG